MNKPFKYGLFLLTTIFIINLLVFLALNLLVKNTPVLASTHFLVIIVAALAAAILISVLVILTAPVLKDLLATWRTLLRLESLSHPLLIRLAREAPGTYNHSLVVANIANKAAKAIGADSLLASVGGYYHDIGKLNHPEIFIENQAENENPHTEMDPWKSAKIIINHTKEGIKLARENKLPPEVVNIIAEHHGTTLMTYFYEKNKEENGSVKKGDFRYPGPKPMSPEGAILMLADAIEAKARLEKDINNKIIAQIVDETIESRLADNQLELSGLNAAKLDRIRTAFIETIEVIFHQRIAYPR